jgi:hypothetical protein
MDDDEEGITVKSKELCGKLLTLRKSRTEGTIFSNEKLFLRTCRRLKGEYETLDHLTTLFLIDTIGLA